MLNKPLVPVLSFLIFSTLAGCHSHHVAEVTLTGIKPGPDIVGIHGTPKTISKGTTLRWKVDSSVAAFQIHFMGASPCDSAIIQSDSSGVAECNVLDSAVKQRGQKYYYFVAVSANAGDPFEGQPPQPCNGCEDNTQ